MKTPRLVICNSNLNISLLGTGGMPFYYIYVPIFVINFDSSENNM